MRRKDGILVMALGVLLIVSGVQAGVLYQAPVGGWAYEYTGDAATYSSTNWASLDGQGWDHNNESDTWNTSEPGGVHSIDNGDDTFLRIQDPFPWAYSGNSRIFLNFDAELEGDTLLDAVTITCRCRLATDLGGDIDPIWNDDYTTQGWPAEGKGQPIDSEGKGHFGIKDGNFSETSSTVRCIGFSLTPATEATELKGKSGLTMNNLNGDTPDRDVDTDSDGTVNVVEVDDLDNWHEFWITIQPSDTDEGTHKVTVYMDGDTTGEVKYVTASSGYDSGGSDIYHDKTLLFMGCPSTDNYSAIDIDFIAYTDSVITPVATVLAPVSIYDPLDGGGGPTTVMEGGYTDTLEVVLTQNPGTTRTVTMTPDSEIDLGNGVGVNKVLTFTTSDWDTPQTVTITADNDGDSGINYSTISSAYSGGGTVLDHTVSVVGKATQIAIVRPGDGVEVLEGSAATDSYDVWVTSGSLPITIEDSEDPCQVVPLTTSTTVSAGSASTISVRAFDDSTLEGDPHTTLIYNTHATVSVPSVIPAVLDNECGAWGYKNTDSNKDCLTDVNDLALFVAEWLNCSLPQTAGCQTYN